SEECVLGVELFDLLERFGRRIFFGQVVQRLMQKILHGRLAVELINIRLTPFIACPSKVRYVRQKNCVAWQKRCHRSARSLLRNSPVVPTSVRGNRDSNDQQKISFHRRRLSGEDARYSMLDAG